ncbi:MAG: ABC transporter ATP-binding protein [Acidobacteriota bacterium]
MIVFRRFRKQFGSQVAVHDLDLEIRQGEVVALLGPNGSGKTTSLKAAAGLIRPSSGDVFVGTPGASSSLASSRACLSYLPQRVSFPESLTGREAVEFFRALRGVARERVDEVLQIAALNGAAERNVGTYSGGMVQRLGLAVALLPAAPVLVLDEPTAALDPDGLSTFYAVVERHTQEGRTVLFSSHQLGDVERLADRFAVLVEGRLVAVLTQREIHEQLSAAGSMRLRLPSCAEEVMRKVRAHSPDASWTGEELVVPGPPAIRPVVIDSIRAAGVEIRGLTSEEGRLDNWYRDVVRTRS